MIRDQFTEEEFDAFYHRLRNYIEAEKVAMGEVRELIDEAVAVERERAEKAIAECIQERAEIALEHQKAFDDGIAAERERCAKIVEDYMPKDWMWTDAQVELPAAIRKGE